MVRIPNNSKNERGQNKIYKMKMNLIKNKTQYKDIIKHIRSTNHKSEKEILIIKLK